MLLCPSEQTLRLLLDDQLGDPRRADLNQHLETCERCKDALTRLTEVAPELRVTIPGYEILSEIGRGGMGIVYKARDQKLDRVVALKVITSGQYAGQDDRRRFSDEARAVASLDHPNIVKIHEIDEHAGHLFLSLEFVEGSSLAERTGGTPMPAERAAEVVQTLAQAMQHAHGTGIVHRDLKPANVLLTADDTPKVADFGLARRLDSAQAMSRTGAVTGTPSYMAPEQVGGKKTDIGPAVDVYGLGAILYELLTGRPPFKGATPLDTLDEVRHKEPVPPSQVVNKVPVDLQTICLKCLHKEARRRYLSAAELADDLGRFRKGEPVQARPVGRLERGWRWCKRNPVVAGLLSATAASLLLGAGVATAFGLEADRKAKAETKARKDAEKDRAAAAESARLALESATAEKKARESAEKRHGQIAQSKDFLASVFLDVTPHSSLRGKKSLQVLLGERLNRAAKQLNEDAIGDPLLVAELQHTLATSLWGLGYPESAIELFEKAKKTREALLPPDDLATLRTKNGLAIAYKDAGNWKSALPLLEETLKKQRLKLGDKNPDTLRSMNNLVTLYMDAGKHDLALPLIVETVEKRAAVLGEKDPDTLRSVGNLAAVHMQMNKPELALPLLEKTCDQIAAVLGDDHPDTLTAMSNLAVTCMALKKLDRALEILNDKLKISRRSLGDDHPDTLASLCILAIAYKDARQPDKAIPLAEEALQKQKVRPGTDHPDTLRTMDILGSVLHDANKLDRAVPLLEEMVEKRKKVEGDDHPNTLLGMMHLAAAYEDEGKHERAVPLLEHVVEKRRIHPGPEHMDTVKAMSRLGQVYMRVRKLNLAIPLLEETLEKQRKELGDNDDETLSTVNILGTAYVYANKVELALPLLEETLKRRREKLGPKHRSTLASMCNLGMALVSADKPERAVPILEEALAKQRETLSDDHVDTLTTMYNLALAYMDVGKVDQAIPLLEENLQKTSRHEGPNSPTLFPLKMWLAEAYDRTKQPAKSEPYHREAVATQRKRYSSDHPATASALAQLGLNLLAQQKWVDAEQVLSESLTIREKRQPDVWTTHNTRSMLGAALLGQKKYAEAERLLTQGYEGMNARKAQIPPQARARLIEALERLVQLGEATEQPQKTEMWRAKLAEARKDVPKTMP